VVVNDDVNRRGTPAFADEGMSTGAKVRIAIAVVAGIALLVFILSNTESAQVSWLGWEFDAPLWIMLLGAALLGALTMQAVGWFVRRNRRT
jgi:uncharacterized integral membrane protein